MLQTFLYPLLAFVRYALFDTGIGVVIRTCPGLTLLLVGIVWTMFLFGLPTSPLHG